MPIDEQRILLTQASPGMVLSRQVSLPNKVTLCSRDTELNEATINRMMTRGIKRVYVKGHPLSGPSQEDYQETMRKLRERFSRVQHVPFMYSLRQLTEKILVKRL